MYGDTYSVPLDTLGTTELKTDDGEALPSGMVPYPVAVRLVHQSLAPAVESAGLPELVMGRTASRGGVVEALLHVDQSPERGALVSVQCGAVVSEVRVTVVPSSQVDRRRARARLVAPFVGLVVGSIAGGLLMDLVGRWLPLVGGLGLALTGFLLTPRPVTSPGSREVADELDACVRAWVKRASRPKKRKKKRGAGRAADGSEEHPGGRSG